MSGPAQTPATDTREGLARRLIGCVVRNPTDSWAAFEGVPVECFANGTERLAGALRAAYAEHGKAEALDPMIASEAVDDIAIVGDLYACAELVETSARAAYFAKSLRKKHEAVARRMRLQDLNRGDIDDDRLVVEIQRLNEEIERGYSSEEWIVSDALKWFTTEPPAREWLFENWLARGIVAQIAATGGTGKSWLSLILSTSLASGLTLIPSLRPSRPCKVLPMLGEDDDPEGHRRGKVLADTYRIELEDLERAGANIIPVCGQAMPLMALRDGNAVPTAAYSQLRAMVKRHKPDLVVLDPQSRWYGLGENDNDHAALFIAYLNQICQEHGCTILMLHHANKQTGQTRGATAFRDGCRWAAELRPLEEDAIKRHAIDPDNAWRYVALVVTKSNYSRVGGEPIILKKGELGVLTEQNLSDERYERIAAWLGEYFKLHGLRLTKREIEKGDGDGKRLRTAVAKAFNECDRDMLVKVVQWSVEHNILDAVMERRGNIDTTVYQEMEITF